MNTEKTEYDKLADPTKAEMERLGGKMGMSPADVKKQYNEARVALAVPEGRRVSRGDNIDHRINRNRRQHGYER